MQYTTYLFDFDYTLADSSKGIVTCFRNVLTKFGYEGISDEDIKRTIGKTLEDSFSILTGVTDADILAEYKTAYGKEANQYMTINTKFFPETVAVLKELKKQGVKLGIISTKYRFRILDFLQSSLPDGFFDVIIGGEDVEQHKPSPEGLLKAIEVLKVQKSDTLYIGDSTVDAETAKAAGVSFVGVLNGMTTKEELSVYPHINIINDLNGLLTEDSDSGRSVRGKKTLFRRSKKTLKRWFTIKQENGHNNNKIDLSEKECKNCGHIYIGNYCNHCGQKYNVKRLSMRTGLENILGSISNIGNGFPRTLLELLYRPGFMIRDYLACKRVKYTHPFQLLFILAAIYVISAQIIKPDVFNEKPSKKINKEELVRELDSIANAKEDGNAKMLIAGLSQKVDLNMNEALAEDSLSKENQTLVKNELPSTHNTNFILNKDTTSGRLLNMIYDWSKRNKAAIILLTLPLFAFFTKMTFPNRIISKSYNFTEHVFIQSYIAAQLLFLSVLYIIFTGNVLINDVYDIPEIVIIIAFIWIYKDLFQQGWFKTILRLLLMSTLCIITLFILLVITGVVWAVFFQERNLNDIVISLN